MPVKKGALRGLAAGALIAGSVALGLALPWPQEQVPVPPVPLEKTIAVAAEAGWVDTAIDVTAGDELRFTATGEVNLQRGNPEAVCGPGGIDLVTLDQPVPNANLGALIGKIAQPIARRSDEDSGAEIVDEIFVLFVIGEEGAFAVPFKGRLYLGLNENVLKDNGGAFSVVVVRRPA